MCKQRGKERAGGRDRACACKRVCVRVPARERQREREGQTERKKHSESDSVYVCVRICARSCIITVPCAARQKKVLSSPPPKLTICGGLPVLYTYTILLRICVCVFVCADMCVCVSTYTCAGEHEYIRTIVQMRRIHLQQISVRQKKANLAVCTSPKTVKPFSCADTFDA